jgi:hypothetical protein
MVLGGAVDYDCETILGHSDEVKMLKEIKKGINKEMRFSTK